VKDFVEKIDVYKDVNAELTAKLEIYASKDIDKDKFILSINAYRD
jgi:hypothetical protein